MKTPAKACTRGSADLRKPCFSFLASQAPSACHPNIPTIVSCHQLFLGICLVCVEGLHFVKSYSCTIGHYYIHKTVHIIKFAPTRGTHVYTGYPPQKSTSYRQRPLAKGYR